MMTSDEKERLADILECSLMSFTLPKGIKELLAQDPEIEQKIQEATALIKGAYAYLTDGKDAEESIRALSDEVREKIGDR